VRRARRGYLRGAPLPIVLVELGPVTFPAYATTTAIVRGTCAPAARGTGPGAVDALVYGSGIPRAGWEVTRHGNRHDTADGRTGHRAPHDKSPEYGHALRALPGAPAGGAAVRAD